MKTAEVHLEGKLVRMISKRVPVVTDLGLYLVGSLIICVTLRTSSLDCRTAGVLSTSQFRSPNSTNSEDRWGAINSHMALSQFNSIQGALLAWETYVNIDKASEVDNIQK